MVFMVIVCGISCVFK